MNSPGAMSRLTSRTAGFTVLGYCLMRSRRVSATPLLLSPVRPGLSGAAVSAKGAFPDGFPVISILFLEHDVTAVPFGQTRAPRPINCGRRINSVVTTSTRLDAAAMVGSVSDVTEVYIRTGKVRI